MKIIKSKKVSIVLLTIYLVIEFFLALDFIDYFSEFGLTLPVEEAKIFGGRIFLAIFTNYLLVKEIRILLGHDKLNSNTEERM